MCLSLALRNPGMEIVQPAVEAVAVDIPRIGTVIAQFANNRVDLFIIRHQRAAVAEGAEVLLDDKTRGACIAEFRHFETVAARANGLGIVFDDVKLVFIGDLCESLSCRRIGRRDGPG